MLEEVKSTKAENRKLREQQEVVQAEQRKDELQRKLEVRFSENLKPVSEKLAETEKKAEHLQQRNEELTEKLKTSEANVNAFRRTVAKTKEDPQFPFHKQSVPEPINPNY